MKKTTKILVLVVMVFVLVFNVYAEKVSNKDVMVKVDKSIHDQNNFVGLSEIAFNKELKVNKSNGKFATIKIMPETANIRAIERLRLKVCSEENNCEIVLKEVGIKNDSRIVYDVSSDKNYKLLYFIPMKAKVFMQLDAETGELYYTKLPFWRWIAKEE